MLPYSWNILVSTYNPGFCTVCPLLYTTWCTHVKHRTCTAQKQALGDKHEAKSSAMIHITLRPAFPCAYLKPFNATLVSTPDSMIQAPTILWSKTTWPSHLKMMLSSLTYSTSGIKALDVYPSYTFHHLIYLSSSNTPEKMYQMICLNIMQNKVFHCNSVHITQTK